MTLISRFFDAIRNGNAEQVCALLAEDPELTRARNQDGATAVLWAIYTRHPELAPLILAGRGPDFFEACALGHRDCVAELLAANPEMAAGNAEDGFGALGLAVFFGHVEIARLLVEAGADVNQTSRNTFRVTPLHSAVASGKLELLDLLLSHGAHPDSPDLQEATPLQSAIGHGNQKMVERLLAAGAKPAK